MDTKEKGGQPEGGPNNLKNLKPQPPKRFNVFWLYAAILVALLGINLLYTGDGAKEVDWGYFQREVLQKGYVEKLVVVRNKGVAEVYLTAEGQKRLAKKEGKEDKKFDPRKPALEFTIGSLEGFERQLQEAQQKAGVSPEKMVYATYVERPDYFVNLLTWGLPLILLVLIWVFIFRRMSKGAAGGGAGNIFSIGKSQAKLFSKGEYTKVDFSDVAGMEEAKQEVREIIDFLKNPKKYTDLGGKIPKGVLLVGPPGTGKTLLAKAVAGEANVPFFSLSGSDFVEMFVGVGVSRVRDLFKQAKEKAPCIIFIDEIDSVGRSRSRNANFSGGAEERENTLNQLLTEMDGFSPNQGVIVLAATNRADILDKALLRSGRFDRQIHVELPDYPERVEIFKVHLKALKLEKDFDLTFLAKQTPGFSGADIANVCNEAALIAARRDAKEVEKQDFLDAIDRLIGGLERKSKVLTDSEKRKIAYHEAGHATVSWHLEHASPLLKVSIIPRGRSLGAAWYVPEERQLNTKDQLFHEMCALLGGRASEDEVFGEVSTGALNDLERANKMAYAMVAYYGMSPALANACYYDSSGESEFAFNKPYSEGTAVTIDAEVAQLISSAYEEAKRILRAHREGLDQLAELLIKDEVIFAEDLERIYGPSVSHTREEEVAESLAREVQKEEEAKQGENGGENGKDAEKSGNAEDAASHSTDEETGTDEKE